MICFGEMITYYSSDGTNKKLKMNGKLTIIFSFQKTIDIWRSFFLFKKLFTSSISRRVQ